MTVIPEFDSDRKINRSDWGLYTKTQFYFLLKKQTENHEQSVEDPEAITKKLLWNHPWQNNLHFPLPQFFHKFIVPL
jgi:hypothetical protein